MILGRENTILALALFHDLFDIVEVEHTVTANVFRYDDDITKPGVYAHVGKNAHVERAFG